MATKRTSKSTKHLGKVKKLAATKPLSFGNCCQGTHFKKVIIE